MRIWNLVRVVDNPDHDPPIRDVFRIHTRDRHEVARFLAIPRLSASWKGWAEQLVQKEKTRH